MYKLKQANRGRTCVQNVWNASQRNVYNSIIDIAIYITYNRHIICTDYRTGIVSHYHMIDHLLPSAVLVTVLYLTKSILGQTFLEE